MADWTGSTANEIRPYRKLTAPLILEFEESTAASSDIIRRGDAVTFDTVVGTASHRIVRGPSSGGDGTNLLQVNIKSLVGIALQDSTSDGGITGLTAGGGGLLGTGRRISVCLATPDQEFLGYASSMAPASSAANYALIGRRVPLVHDRTHKRYFVATANTTAALGAVEITGIPEYAIGDSGVYPVIFKFLSTNLSPIVPGSNQ